MRIKFQFKKSKINPLRHINSKINCSSCGYGCLQSSFGTCQCVFLKAAVINFWVWLLCCLALSRLAGPRSRPLQIDRRPQAWALGERCIGIGHPWGAHPPHVLPPSEALLAPFTPKACSRVWTWSHAFPAQGSLIPSRKRMASIPTSEGGLEAILPPKNFISFFHHGSNEMKMKLTQMQQLHLHQHHFQFLSFPCWKIAKSIFGTVVGLKGSPLVFRLPRFLA